MSKKAQPVRKEGGPEFHICKEKVQLDKIDNHSFPSDHVVMEVHPTGEVAMEKLKCPACAQPSLRRRENGGIDQHSSDTLRELKGPSIPTRARR